MSLLITKGVRPQGHAAKEEIGDGTPLGKRARETEKKNRIPLYKEDKMAESFFFSLKEQSRFLAISVPWILASRLNVWPLCELGTIKVFVITCTFCDWIENRSALGL